MRYRSLFLSMLLASAVCAADEVPTGEALASAASVKPAQGEAAVQTEPLQTEPVQAKPGQATPASQGKSDGGDKSLSGMSILGNQEAPKSLVIVPWKSSELGDTLGLAESLDDARQPVDKQVFMRELSYYEIRSSSK
jgi:hypothetical protein